MTKLEIISKINNCYASIEKAYTNYAKCVGLSNTLELEILELIYTSQKAYTQKEIVKIKSCSKQILNLIIKSFWESGYVELKESKDRRNKEIFLTEKGYEYAKKIIDESSLSTAKVLDNFSVEELERFLETFSKYEKAITRALSNE